MIHNLMEQIERGWVSADLMLASTPRTLMERLEENPVIREARTIVHDDPASGREIANRAMAIMGEPVDAEYVRPGDLALAAYLYILAREAPASARKLIGAAAAADPED